MELKIGDKITLDGVFAGTFPGSIITVASIEGTTITGKREQDGENIQLDISHYTFTK